MDALSWQTTCGAQARGTIAFLAPGLSGGFGRWLGCRSVMSRWRLPRADGKDMPLQRGPLVGAAYCVAGLAVGYAASRVGGWLAAPIWLIAGLLFVAGVWTVAFTGFFLRVIRRAERAQEQ